VPRRNSRTACRTAAAPRCAEPQRGFLDRSQTSSGSRTLTVFSYHLVQPPVGQETDDEDEGFDEDDDEDAEEDEDAEGV
jgi:hypothetical protein